MYIRKEFCAFLFVFVCFKFFFSFFVFEFVEILKYQNEFINKFTSLFTILLFSYLL